MQIAIRVEPPASVDGAGVRDGDGFGEGSCSLRPPRHLRTRAASSPGLMADGHVNVAAMCQAASLQAPAAPGHRKGAPFIVLRPRLPLLPHSRTNTDIKRFALTLTMKRLTKW